MEKLDYLIEYLLNERSEKVDYKNLDKKRLFRSLSNIREAKEISEEFLKVQDQYLKEENTVVENIEDSKMKDGIYLWKGDITTLKIQSIVNAANSKGLGCFIPCHNCIDNSIHSASGIQLRLECYEKMKEIKKLETGKAFLTKAYNLPSEYVIHTTGPIITKKVTENDKQQLKNCYISSLEIAKENEIREIAFCNISTGEFRFPKKIACKIAINTVKEYLKKNNEYFDKIVFDVFSDEDYRIYLENLR